MSGDRLRDARRVGFAMVYKSATQRIRAHFGGPDCTVKVSTGLAVYVALAELTNDARHDPDTGIPRGRIAEYAGVTPKSVSDTLPELERGGLIHVERRQVDGVNLPNVITLLDTDTVSEDQEPEVPGVGTSGVEGSEPEVSPKKNGEDHKEQGGRSAGASERVDQFPDDLPADLHDVAIAAGKVLKATAMKRGQPKAVTRAAVGQAVMSWPDRDHVQVARDVEYWLLHGNGAGKSCRDVVARFRSFLKSSEPRAAGPMAVAAGGNVRPIRPRGGAMTASDLLEAGRRLSGGGA